MPGLLLAPPFPDAAELAVALNCLPDGGPAWTADPNDVVTGIAGDLTEIAVWAPAADPEHVAGLVGYFLRGSLALGGEWSDDYVNVAADGICRFDPDLTKSRRDDWAWVLWDPETGLEAVLAEGSPVRKTDRMGAGTRGTRRWGPLPGPVLVVWR